MAEGEVRQGVAAARARFNDEVAWGLARQVDRAATPWREDASARFEYFETRGMFIVVARSPSMRSTVKGSTWRRAGGSVRSFA